MCNRQKVTCTQIEGLFILNYAHSFSKNIRKGHEQQTLKRQND